MNLTRWAVRLMNHTKKHTRAREAMNRLFILSIIVIQKVALLLSLFIASFFLQYQVGLCENEARSNHCPAYCLEGTDFEICILDALYLQMRAK